MHKGVKLHSKIALDYIGTSIWNCTVIKSKIAVLKATDYNIHYGENYTAENGK